MPVTNAAQVVRFAQLAGAAFPSHLAARFDAIADDGDAVRALGVELASELCQRLLDEGAPGLHFYTLNRSTATREIAANLGLGDASSTGA
jgi:methylenetetrahydrofolate reductase (NADPH)